MGKWNYKVWGEWMISRKMHKQIGMYSGWMLIVIEPPCKQTEQILNKDQTEFNLHVSFV